MCMILKIRILYTNSRGESGVSQHRNSSSPRGKQLRGADNKTRKVGQRPNKLTMHSARVKILVPKKNFAYAPHGIVHELVERELTR